MLAGLQSERFDELAERSLMSPLAGMKHGYVRLATRLRIKNKTARKYKAFLFRMEKQKNTDTLALF